MTTKQQAWYQSALDAFATAARRSAWNDGGKTWELCKVAAKLNIPFSRLETDVECSLGLSFSKKHADCLRRSFGRAVERFGGSARSFVRTPYRPQRTPTVDAKPDTVKKLLVLGGGTATEDDLIALSPVKPTDTIEDAERLIEALFLPDQFMYICTKGPALARLGFNIRRRDEWQAAFSRGDTLPGDLVGVTPIASGRVSNMNGNRGVRVEDLSPYQPYVVLEMDELALENQLAFFVGLLKSEHASSVVSLVHSAGRSIHAIVNVGLEHGTRESRIARLRGLFASDPDEVPVTTKDGETKTVHPFRVDENGFGPLFKSRLPGVIRADNDRLQRLLYFNPDAVPRR